MANTSSLQTNFNVAPYFDDFDENKQYYRVLFRPATAVQARELTQIQTVLQNQITRSSQSIYKDGSIIEGCGFSKYPNIEQVKFKDSNTSTYDFSLLTVNHTDLANGYILVSNTTGLRAQVFRAFVGAESAIDAGSQDTNRAYVIYGPSGNNSGTEVKRFNSVSEQVDVYSSDQSLVGPLVPTNRLGSIYTITANNTVNTYGVGYGMHVAQGIVFQKGFFIKVLPDNVIIKEHSSNVIGMKVGFDTKEYIIKPAQDPTLYDNSIGSPNYSAPGAHRLKLVPQLYYYDSSNTQVQVPADFMPIVDFSGGTGVPVTSSVDPYSSIYDFMATRTREESGNYVVKPFQIDVTAHESNNQLFYYGASPGTAYVDGYRVSYESPRKVVAKRAFTSNWLSNQKITTNFGNYIKIKNVAGTFDVGNDQEVTIYSANQSILSMNQSYTGTGFGVAVGKANIRAILPSPSSPAAKGLPDAEFLAYLFNIRMNQGSSFASNAQSIVAINGAFGNCYADIVVDPIQGQIVAYETDKGVLLYDSGLPGLKRLTSNTGVNATTYVYRSTQTSSITRTTGTGGANNITVVFTAPGSDSYNYGVGTLSDPGESAVNLTFGTDFVTNPILGPWSTGSMNIKVGGLSNATSSNIVTGDWLSNFDGTTPGSQVGARLFVGQGIKLDWTSPLGGTVSSYHTVTNINSANSITVTPNTSASVVPVAGSMVMYRFFKNGTPIDFTGSGNTMSFSSSTNLTVKIALDANTTQGSNFTINAQIPTQKSSAVPIEKVVRKSVYVAINCNSHWATTNGPWNLGLPDVFNVSSVYVGSTFSTSNPDQIGWFTYTNGQQDSYYGHGTLVIKPQFKSRLTTASRMLVKLDCFSANISPTKAGFFSVDSYPIDDLNTSNTQAVQTAQIPVYRSVSGINYDLRNHIDLRPVFANTAVISFSPTWGSYTVNPANNFTTFYTGTGNPISIEPNANFNYNVEYYLPRIDSLIMNKDGVLDVKYGVPAASPVTPSINTSGLKLADIYVPPYPSLTFTEAE